MWSLSVTNLVTATTVEFVILKSPAKNPETMRCRLWSNRTKQNKTEANLRSSEGQQRDCNASQLLYNYKGVANKDSSDCCENFVAGKTHFNTTIRSNYVFYLIINILA